MAGLKVYITDAGRAALTMLLLSGQPLVITRAALGDGKVASEAEARALTELKHRTMDAELVSSKITNGFYRVSVRKVNLGLTEGTTVNEIALYCTNPANPNVQVMFYYATFGDNPDWIAPASIAQYVRTYDLGFEVSLASSVSIQVSPSGLVSYEELEEYLAGVFTQMDDLSEQMTTLQSEVTQQLTETTNTLNQTVQSTATQLRGEMQTLGTAKQNELKPINVTLSKDDWAAYDVGTDDKWQQTVDVAGWLMKDNFFATYADGYKYPWQAANISALPTTLDGAVTFVCAEKPEQDVAALIIKAEVNA